MTQYVFPDSGTAESIDQLPDPLCERMGAELQILPNGRSSVSI